MKYQTFRDKQEKKYSEFPLVFAFSDKQLEEGKEKLGVKDNNELSSIGGGGYIKKTDSEAYKNLINGFDRDLKTFLKDDKQFVEALEYELSNHEYCITYDYEPTLDALGLSFESLTEKQKDLLVLAKKNYLEKVID
mgnify:CR=1 FL=1